MKVDLNWIVSVENLNKCIKKFSVDQERGAVHCTWLLLESGRDGDDHDQ